MELDGTYSLRTYPRRYITRQQWEIHQSQIEPDQVNNDIKYVALSPSHSSHCPGPWQLPARKQDAQRSQEEPSHEDEDADQCIEDAWDLNLFDVWHYGGGSAFNIAPVDKEPDQGSDSLGKREDDHELLCQNIDEEVVVILYSDAIV